MAPLLSVRSVTARKALNIVLFQAAWFASVLGAARGHDWHGPLAVFLALSIHFLLVDNRPGELALLLSAGLLGFCFDTAMSAAGVLTPLGQVMAHPLSQPWMTGLWLLFASTLNVSLEWLKKSYVLAAVFGAAGGTFAYYGGAKLGATVAVPDLQGIVVLALGWGIMNPVLVWLAVRFQKTGSTGPEPGGIAREGGNAP